MFLRKKSKNIRCETVFWIEIDARPKIQCKKDPEQNMCYMSVRESLFTSNIYIYSKPEASAQSYAEPVAELLMQRMACVRVEYQHVHD